MLCAVLCVGCWNESLAFAEDLLAGVVAMWLLVVPVELLLEQRSDMVVIAEGCYVGIAE